MRSYYSQVNKGKSDAKVEINSDIDEEQAEDEFADKLMEQEMAKIGGNADLDDEIGEYEDADADSDISGGFFDAGADDFGADDEDLEDMEDLGSNESDIDESDGSAILDMSESSEEEEQEAAQFKGNGKLKKKSSVFADADEFANILEQGVESQNKWDKKRSKKFSK